MEKILRWDVVELFFITFHFLLTHVNKYIDDDDGDDGDKKRKNGRLHDV